jgi:uncharacterized protein YciI
VGEQPFAGEEFIYLELDDALEIYAAIIGCTAAQAGIDPALPRLATSVLLTLHGIHLLVYSRAAAGAADVDDPALNEEHWAYMERFAEGMVARGPTLTADRASWTGSLHIVDLPSTSAAREFVEREPYNRAGLFCDHFVRRFETRLGR